MLATIRNSEFRKLLFCWPEQAIRILYESHYDALLIISLRITRDVNAAEEVVQHLFASLWTNHKRLHVANEPIQLELVRWVRTKSLQYLRSINKSNHGLKSGPNEKPHVRLNKELEDVAFLTGNIPELPDEYALDDNFYYGLRQIEYKANEIRRKKTQLRDIGWKALLIGLAILSISTILFIINQPGRTVRNLSLFFTPAQ